MTTEKTDEIEETEDTTMEMLEHEMGTLLRQAFHLGVLEGIERLHKKLKESREEETP